MGKGPPLDRGPKRDAFLPCHHLWFWHLDFGQRPVWRERVESARERERERERAAKLRRAKTQAQTNRKQAGGSRAFVLTVSQGNEREVCWSRWAGLMCFSRCGTTSIWELSKQLSMRVMCGTCRKRRRSSAIAWSTGRILPWDSVRYRSFLFYFVIFALRFVCDVFLVLFGLDLWSSGGYGFVFFRFFVCHQGG